MNEVTGMEALVRNAVLAEQLKKRPNADSDDRPKKLQKRSCDETTMDGEIPSGHDNMSSKRGGKGRQKEEFSYPVEPRLVSVIKKPRTIMNHSYRDFSCVPKELKQEEPTKIEDMSFSQKVHSILSLKENEPIISWMAHGRAFRVHIPKLFEEQVCLKYFGHSRYSSFLRLLNNYGFKHITKGPDRNCYYHECFLRGMPHLCEYMPKHKNARHLIPDPDNEPDFYRLSKLFPLGDQEMEIEIPSQDKKIASTESSNAVPPAAQRELAHAASLPSVAAGVLPTSSMGTSSLLTPHQTSSSSVLTASSLIRQQQLISQAAAVDHATLEHEAMLLRAAALRESLKNWRTGGFLF